MFAHRALRAGTTSSYHTRPVFAAAPSTLCVRFYAAKKPYQPPHPSGSIRPPTKNAPPSRSHPPRPPTTPQVHQASPGTNLPKNQTWQPKDGIKLQGSQSTAFFGAEMMGDSRNTDAARRMSSQTPLDGTRPEDPTKAKNPNPLEHSGQSREISAQEMGADKPMPGGVREETHRRQAAAENIPPSSEPPTGSEDDSAKEIPRGPLPDLRQGLPSTFDMEFSDRKQDRGSQDFKTGLTRPESGSLRDEQERDYNQADYETSLDRQRKRMASLLYAMIAFGAVTSAFYLARPFSPSESPPQDFREDAKSNWSPLSMWARMRARLGGQMGYYTEPTFPKLLPDVPTEQRPPYTLVLSLEDLLIHTSWDRKHGYRTAKRPGVDYFIRYLHQYYELVLFTSSPMAIAEPVIRKFDPHHLITYPLTREATRYQNGQHVKDLDYLNRDLGKTIIIDTNAAHVQNQTENAIVLPKWRGDREDPHAKDLVALIPFLENIATMGVQDVRTALKSFEGQSIPEEFARREAEARKKFNEQLEAERAKKPKRSLGGLAKALGMKSSGTGLMLPDGQSVGEGLREGKMLSDQYRELGIKQVRCRGRRPKFLHRTSLFPKRS